ncbi:hypothetical protein ACFQ08_08110, partial [Streptosporangium algeriense]
AFVVGPSRDVLAGTALAARVNPAWSPGHNLIEFTFLDPRARQVYPDWEEISLQAVAGLRTTAAARPAELGGFVASLRERSETFRALWDSHDVYDRVTGEKRLAVDGVGVLSLGFETFALAGPEGHVLCVYFPRPGSKDATALRALAQEEPAESEAPDRNSQCLTRTSMSSHAGPATVSRPGPRIAPAPTER